MAHTSNTQKNEEKPYTSAKIELYKKNAPAVTYLTASNTIKKNTIFKTPTAFSQETADEEILSINVDNEIPIDFNKTLSDNKKALITTNINNNLSASLPSEINTNTTQNATNTNNETINSDDVLELVNSNKHKLSLPGDNIIDNQASFMVAERIKESVLFPISEEILNDENLTPTFINIKNKSKTKENKKPSITKKETTQQITKTTQTATHLDNQKKNSNSLLDNLSSLFQKKEKNPTDTQKNKKVAPTYSNNTTPQTNLNKTQKNTQKNQQIGSFYEALKETKYNHEVKNIIPKELSLHFNPNKAEITGKTLKWIKILSNETIKNNKRLKITLANTTDTPLQEKRLNLLYNILTSTDIDFSKIDISTANINEDTFIIMIKNNNQEM
jgi:hypothetical protein